MCNYHQQHSQEYQIIPHETYDIDPQLIVTKSNITLSGNNVHKSYTDNKSSLRHESQNGKVQQLTNISRIGSDSKTLVSHRNSNSGERDNLVTKLITMSKSSMHGTSAYGTST